MGGHGFGRPVTSPQEHGVRAISLKHRVWIAWRKCRLKKLEWDVLRKPKSGRGLPQSMTLSRWERAVGFITAFLKIIFQASDSFLLMVGRKSHLLWNVQCN